MKYIRTESGIYELFSSNSRSSKFLYPTKNGYRLCQRENWRCRFADTIEELCDEFVICCEGKPICQFACKIWNNNKMKSLSNGNDFYGAIWTDKGLIYVAKMNDKGELELL